MSQASFRTALGFCVTLAAASTFAHAYGEPDPTYHPVPVPGWSCDNTALATLADGSVFLAGVTPVATIKGGIVKFRPDGSPDPTWGASGVAQVPDIAPGKLLVPTADGGLYVLGSRITKLLANGSMDNSFAFNSALYRSQAGAAAVTETGGIAYFRVDMFPIPTEEPATQPTLVVLDSGGNLTRLLGFTSSANVYAWSVANGGMPEFATYTLDAQGRRDLELIGFLPAGIGDFEQVFSPKRLIPATGTSSWMWPAAAVDAYGGVIFLRFNPADRSLSLVRNGPDGAPDGTFGAQSLPVAALPTAENFSVTPRALWRTTGGGWTALAAISGQGSESLFVVRFTADGRPDPNFPQYSVLADRNYARLDDGSLIANDPKPTSCQLARFLTDDKRVEGTIIEYYHPALDHYFLTLDGSEAASLDHNVATLGWQRTGRTFGAWQAVDVPGAVEACRFYGDPVIGPNSHFYTTDANECAGLRAIEASTPPGVPAWHFEGYAFSAANAVGPCPSNLAPVYRAFSGPAAPASDPHHRYMTDPDVYAQIVNSGWIGEGVRFCVPPRPSRTLFFDAGNFQLR